MSNIDLSGKFTWTKCYEEVATKLLSYRNRRDDLIDKIQIMSGECEFFKHLHDKTVTGKNTSLTDICPFTFMATFNRRLKAESRLKVLQTIANFLQIESVMPRDFAGIPGLPPRNSMFFVYQYSRRPDDIDVLWTVFERALEYADNKTGRQLNSLIAAFDEATNRSYVKWNLTIGLFWSRPYKFLPLDENTRNYVTRQLNIKIPIGNNGSSIGGWQYFDLIDKIENRFSNDDFQFHSFPELSVYAWRESQTKKDPKKDDKNKSNESVNLELGENEANQGKKNLEGYTTKELIKEGSFLSESELKRILAELRRKKNIILQGPPGTGKSWLARRLAYALIGQKDLGRVRAVQFHPNFSYEDFVRGWRPSGEDGRLQLVDGPFVEIINKAKNNPDIDFVLVVEEINRGNPAQIFGEMLTLLEVDKRNPLDALELSYRRDDEERIYVPKNLYVIGTMNIADRSLAQMDLALRRRFAFVNLKPMLNEVWHKQLVELNGINEELVDAISEKLTSINDQIKNDPNLGEQFQIGHSFVTPLRDEIIDDGIAWFHSVVESEIGPLLDEYWLDDPEKAKSLKKDLLDIA